MGVPPKVQPTFYTQNIKSCLAKQGQAGSLYAG